MESPSFCSSPQEQQTPTNEQEIAADKLFEEDKITLFKKRQALEWHAANRELHVRDNYNEQVRMLMLDNKLSEDDYETWKANQWKNLH